jgi:NAD(P)-dependent dehydrogenase (short-subunit alcohol dehydrogenase family)
VLDRLESSAQRAADAIVAAGGEATAYAADLANVSACEVAMDKVIAQVGQLDAIVDVHDLVDAPALLNGDKGQPMCPHTEATVAAGVAKRVLTREGRGSLIFVVRAVGLIGVDADLAIGAHAWGGWFTDFTHALARQLVPSGIRVNTILARSLGDEQDARSSRALSDAVQLLLSARGHSLTGQVLRFTAATSPVQ